MSSEESSADYYDILGISKTATTSEIKKGYRTQALKWHPDKNPDNKEEAEKRFKEVAEAYEVLSDKEKKRVYDKYGKEGLNPSNGGGTSYTHSAHFDGFPAFSGFHFQDPMDLFAQFFGGSDPFEDIFTPRSRAHHSSRPSHTHQSAAGFGFPGFGFQSGFGMGGFGNSSLSMFNGHNNFFAADPFANGFGSASFSSSGFGGGGMTMSSSSTTIENGKRVTTTRVVEDGKETVTVSENGRVISRKVNGADEPERLEYNTEPPRGEVRSSNRRRRN